MAYVRQWQWRSKHSRDCVLRATPKQLKSKRRGECKKGSCPTKCSKTGKTRFAQKNMLILDNCLSLKKSNFSWQAHGVATFNVENSVLLTPRTGVYGWIEHLMRTLFYHIFTMFDLKAAPVCLIAFVPQQRVAKNEKEVRHGNEKSPVNGGVNGKII